MLQQQHPFLLNPASVSSEYGRQRLGHFTPPICRAPQTEDSGFDIVPYIGCSFLPGTYSLQHAESSTILFRNGGVTSPIQHEQRFPPIVKGHLGRERWRSLDLWATYNDHGIQVMVTLGVIQIMPEKPTTRAGSGMLRERCLRHCSSTIMPLGRDLGLQPHPPRPRDRPSNSEGVSASAPRIRSEEIRLAARGAVKAPLHTAVTSTHVHTITSTFDPKATDFPETATHAIDFGPGGLSGIGPLTASNLDGRGVRIVIAGHRGKEDAELDDALEVNDGTMHINTPFSRLLGKPPIMVAGMTPSTVKAGFVGAVLDAGYHVQLAGGGHYNAAALRAKVAEIQQLIPAGVGITLNVLYINPRQFDFQFPLWQEMCKEGLLIEGFCVVAGIPSTEKADDIIDDLKRTGINHVAFKPASVNGIRQVINIAAFNADFPIIMQWTGGFAGGHIITYSATRPHANIVLVKGSSFGSAEDVWPHLTGDWTVERFSVQPMPFDGFLFASRVMAKEVHTSVDDASLPFAQSLDFDDTIFKLFKKKRAAWLNERQDGVIGILNKTATAKLEETEFRLEENTREVTDGDIVRRRRHNMVQPRPPTRTHHAPAAVPQFRRGCRPREYLPFLYPLIRNEETRPAARGGIEAPFTQALEEIQAGVGLLSTSPGVQSDLPPPIVELAAREKGTHVADISLRPQTALLVAATSGKASIVTLFGDQGTNELGGTSEINLRISYSKYEYVPDPEIDPDEEMRMGHSRRKMRMRICIVKGRLGRERWRSLDLWATYNDHGIQVTVTLGVIHIMPEKPTTRAGSGMLRERWTTTSAPRRFATTTLTTSRPLTSPFGSSPTPTPCTSITNKTTATGCPPSSGANWTSRAFRKSARSTHRRLHSTAVTTAIVIATPIVIATTSVLPTAIVVLIIALPSLSLPHHRCRRPITTIVTPLPPSSPHHRLSPHHHSSALTSPPLFTVVATAIVVAITVVVVATAIFTVIQVPYNQQIPLDIHSAPALHRNPCIDQGPGMQKHQYCYGRLSLNQKRAILTFEDTTTRLSNVLSSVNGSSRHWTWTFNSINLRWDCRTNIDDGSPIGTPYLKARFSAALSSKIPSATPSILTPWSQATSAIASALPVASLFPLVDLWRLALLDPSVGTWVSSFPTSSPILLFIDKATAALKIPDPTSNPRNYLLKVLRLLSNAFATPALARSLFLITRAALAEVVIPSLLHTDGAVTVDALSHWASSTRQCASALGKKNFLITGEVTGGDTFGALYIGRGRTATQLPPGFLAAANVTPTDNYFLRDRDLGGLDGVAFHYSIYRAISRFLGMDGNLQVAYDVGTNFVTAWNQMFVSNDFLNAETGLVDPRHMYGTSNFDVFRWPSLENGTQKSVLGTFITTLVMPGIPLLYYGEEQNFYLYDNGASNYLYGRQAMTGNRAWKRHGCYAMTDVDLIWVVPKVKDIDYPAGDPAEPIEVIIFGEPYLIEVETHVLDNITYVILDSPVFRAQTKSDPYPARMDDLSSAIFYSTWNQAIAATIRRFPTIDIYHINDYHGALAGIYLLPKVIPACLSLHNAEFQGLWPLRTKEEMKEVCSAFNISKEHCTKYVQFGNTFNLLHAAASFISVHQKSVGVAGVSDKYGKRSWARYPALWTLKHVDSLPNPDPDDIAALDENPTAARDVQIDEVAEAARPEHKRQAQEWAGIKQDPDSDLFVFVGRWSKQKGVDLIADVMPSILEKRPSIQLIAVGPVIDLYGRFAAEKLARLMELYPDRVYSKPEFTALPPYLFSGADFALIPSRDEPFGLVAVEFGRKGALGVGSRLGGLGLMPGWWYPVESSSTAHMLSQLTKTIKMALKSTEEERAILRARSAVQRFPVVEWRQRMEDFDKRSINMSRSIAGHNAWRESDCDGGGVAPIGENEDWNPGRVDKVKGGAGHARDNTLKDEDWEVEMVSTVVQALGRETTSEEVVHRLAASPKVDAAEDAFPSPSPSPDIALTRASARFTVPSVLGALRHSMAAYTHSLVLNESISNYLNVWMHMRPEVPGSLLTSGGSSLGWALGAAVGAFIGGEVAGGGDEEGGEGGERKRKGKGYDLILALLPSSSPPPPSSLLTPFPSPPPPSSPPSPPSSSPTTTHQHSVTTTFIYLFITFPAELLNHFAKELAVMDCKKGLINMALSSKSMTDIALGLLWSQQESFIPLLRLLPACSWDLQHGQYGTKTVPNTIQRIQYYGSAMKVLRLGSRSWGQATGVTDEVHLHGKLLSRIMNALVLTPGRLHTFACHEESDILPRMIDNHFVHLIYPHDIPSPVWKYLGIMPSLNDLAIHFKHDDNLRLPGPAPFYFPQSLEKAFLTGDVHNFIPMLQSLKVSNLKMLTLHYTDVIKDEEDLEDVFGEFSHDPEETEGEGSSDLEHHFSTLQSLILDAWQMDTPGDMNLDSAIAVDILSILQHLRHCTQLQVLQVNPPGLFTPFVIPPTLPFSSLWPNLTHLALATSNNNSDQDEHFPLMHLSDVIRLTFDLKNLKALDILFRMDTTGIPLCPTLSKPSIIHLGDSTGPTVATSADIAVFLRKVFPNLNGLGRSLNMDSADEDLCSPTRILTVLSSKLQHKDKEMIQLFVLLFLLFFLLLILFERIKVEPSLNHHCARSERSRKASIAFRIASHLVADFKRKCSSSVVRNRGRQTSIETKRTFHIPCTSGTNACPPNIPSVPTSKLTRVTSSASVLSCATIEFTVIFRSSISPCTSTFTSFPRSPKATALVTFEMERTWSVNVKQKKKYKKKNRKKEKSLGKGVLRRTLTFRVRSAHVPWTPSTLACPPKMPCVPTSSATRVTSLANAESWSTIEFTVPVGVIEFNERDIRSPRATAVVTFAMERTWSVREKHMRGWLTFRTSSNHTPSTSGTCAWPPSLPWDPTSRVTRVTSAARARSLTGTRVSERWMGALEAREGDALDDHSVDGILQIEYFTAGIDLDLLGEIAEGDGFCDFSDGADLGRVGEGDGDGDGDRKERGRTWLVRFAASLLTTPVSSRHVPSMSRTRACPPNFLQRMSNENGVEEREDVPFCADFLTDPSDFLCELAELVDHSVDNILELDHDDALDRDSDFLAEIATGLRHCRPERRPGPRFPAIPHYSPSREGWDSPPDETCQTGLSV
ncbi:hypothetical protein D9615_010216 [Tricholomella constricta]|uniref:Alpha-1,3-glucan synthase n=1 Tax=Tricholomella constricta TaxID=117010 RepID=A0A8H5GNH2_9AGAR|nr:hypothetical protein D9615_010216 [Tricholomella constricta]